MDIVTTNDNGAGSPHDAELYCPLQEDGATYRYFPRQTRFYTCSLPLAVWLWKHVPDYDLVHVHALFSFSSTAAAIVAIIRRVPYIVRPLGILNRWGMRNRHPLFKRFSFHLLERRILQHARAVQFTSEAEKSEAEALGARFTAAIIPNPVDLAADAGEVRKSPGSPGPVYLFLSRIDEKKGLDLLLKAFAIVRHELPESRLAIAGEGPAELTLTLREQAGHLGIADSVAWLGFVEGDAKRKAAAEADVFVLPSYSENFGVSVVEAMGAGLPVVITDQVGIHPLITRSKAGVVTPCTAEAFAQGMLAVGRSPALAAEMGSSGSDAANREFSVAAVSGSLIDLYRFATLPPISTQVESAASGMPPSPRIADTK